MGLKSSRGGDTQLIILFSITLLCTISKRFLDVRSESKYCSCSNEIVCYNITTCIEKHSFAILLDRGSDFTIWGKRHIGLLTFKTRAVYFMHKYYTRSIPIH